MNSRMTSTNGYTNRNFELEPDEITGPRQQSNPDGQVNSTYEDDTEIRTELSRRDAAVLVREASKQYGSGGTPVLQNFNMNVKKGTIYGLLGASGCGKTTLLSCIVALRRLDKGEILIHGAATGTPASGVPGKRIGYMPQEVALYGEFTIKEAMQYFGRMFGMTLAKIQKKMDFLVDLLNLPPSDRKIGTLSGGQKRRVSFAVTLVHNPEILILDEPTVGVDPLLRQSIWRYLCELVSNGRTTVIITTHYIEEARQADTVGIMRSGILLAEDSPVNLMKRHQCSLLEDIVLKLSTKDERNAGGADVTNDPNGVSFGNERNSQILKKKKGDIEMADVISISYNQWKEQIDDDNSMTMTAEPHHKSKPSPPKKKEKLRPYRQPGTLKHRLKALTIKNVIMLLRNVGFLLFVFILPAVQIACICLAIGGDPHDIRIGVINKDVPDSRNCTIEEGCPIDNLSCRYLKEVDTESVVQVHFDSEEEAIREVEKGKLWGFISFPEGYSVYMFERALSGSSLVDNDTIYGSRFQVRLDMSNKQIGQNMKKIFFDAFRDFATTLMRDCDIDPTGRDLPLYFGTPIYGTDDTSFREFVAPSIAVGCLYFFTMCSCGLVYIIEKREGMLDRTLVAGVSTIEIMISHFITQFFVCVGQVALAFIVLFPIFGIAIHGSTIMVVLILLLVGVSGMSYGFLISTICNEEKHAIQLAMASFFPNVMLAGMMWPIEAMPGALQYFAYALPCTLAGETVRSLLTRGWAFTHPNVWHGFASTLTWIALIWIVTTFIHLRFRT